MNYYYTSTDQQSIGPLEENDIRNLRYQGVITDDTFVTPVGGTERKSYRELFCTTTPPPLPITAKQNMCIVCKSDEVVEGFAIPLCARCRELAAKRPIPPLLKLCFIFIGCCLLFSITRLPRELKASIAYDKGYAAEQAKNYKAACAHYERALSFYPKSPAILERLVASSKYLEDKQQSEKWITEFIKLRSDPSNSEETRKNLMQRIIKAELE